MAHFSLIENQHPYPGLPKARIIKSDHFSQICYFCNVFAKKIGKLFMAVVI